MASNVPFNSDSGDENKIQFRITDMAGNVGTSDLYTVQIDTAPPTISSPVAVETSDYLHAVGTMVYYGSNMAGIEEFMIFGNAIDSGSGLDRATFSYFGLEPPVDDDSPEDQSQSYHVNPGVDGSDTITVTIYDNTGNSAIQTFTVIEDNDSPSNPISYSSSHTPSVWSSDNTIDISWSGASDALSGLKDFYAVVWDNSPTTVPPTGFDVLGTSTTSPALADGDWYFHVRAVDNVLNWADGAYHVGPFHVGIPPNEPPVAYDQSVDTAEDTALAITLTASDMDVDDLTFSIVDQPANGELSGTPPYVTYTPTPGFHGADFFTFKANDSQADSNVATIFITVTPAAQCLFKAFVIRLAKIDFNMEVSDDEAHVRGRMKLDLFNGDGVDISEEVKVTVGSLCETIMMAEKGRRDIRWEYRRGNGGEGNIVCMNINWRTGIFRIYIDSADFSGLSDPDEVTIRIQVGDDCGEETISMKETRHWDYKAPQILTNG